MAETTPVLEYKCPCCGAGLTFEQQSQKLHCASCDNSFELETVQELYAPEENGDSEDWEDTSTAQWSEEERDNLQSFLCPSCGGELLTDGQTAATFCPFCENPAILSGRVSGGLKPDAVLPFKKSKEDAKSAFLSLCKGKPLLPKEFTTQQRIEKITGIYVPFWLYDCSADQNVKFQATRVHSWSDSKYHYTRTDHYLLTRGASAAFSGIPMDGSSKMDNAIMESIEPFDYDQLADFDPAYLTGFFADRYDVESKLGQERVRQRAGSSMDEMIRKSVVGYATAVPMNRRQNIRHGKAKYVLLPVWMLYTRYKDQTYVFAMNGQTGKMTGTFPVCPKRSAAWFAGICAAVTALVTLIQYVAL